MKKVFVCLLGLVLLYGCGGGGSGSSGSAQVLEPAPQTESEPEPTPGPEPIPSDDDTQPSVELPSYNTSPKAPDNTGMESTAAQIASQMTIGLNIGNTLEAWGGKSETYWGNPEITREFVAFAKASGFNAIRLPVSWDQYADQSTAEIEQAWLDRVKEVVQYCIDEDMYVLVNIHWDGGWLEKNITPDKQAAVNSKQKAYWEQIATLLRDFDERLLFAGANEPDVDNEAEMEVLLSYYQTFVDAVRSTGGRNAYRTLVLPGPDTNMEHTYEWMVVLPMDTASERLMVEVHFYAPFNFALMEKDESWGNQFFYWGIGNYSNTDTDHNPTWGEEDYVDETFNLMKVQFADQGIPVILGEYNARLRDQLTGDDLELHLKSRAYYHSYVTQRALATGMIPFYWDTGSLLDRREYTVRDQQSLDALMEGAAHPSYWKDKE